MKLKRFRVTNFRSVVDSGWVDAEEVTALVGVNESGKTNLLLPLWKLNPAREGEIKPTSDYPKAAFNQISQSPASFVFITADFATDDLAPRLAALTGLPQKDVELVRISRTFDSIRHVSFPDHKIRRELPESDVLHVLENGKSELMTTSTLAKEGDLKQILLAGVRDQIVSFTGNGAATAERLRAAAEELAALRPENPAPTSSLVPRLIALLEELETEAARLESPEPGKEDKVFDLVIQSLPSFVYYSNYGNLDSEIYLPHIVQNLRREDLGGREAAKARTLRVLFSFVTLAPEQILELGREIPPDQRSNEAQVAKVAENKRMRTIMMNSAATDLTKRFKDWWRQGNYTFEFQADGDHFRIWVSDSKRPEKVELEDRSTGLQWFLSFYLVFLVESEQSHKNAILLLDEPGLSLHPLAQRDLSDFFNSLSQTNQIIYTTHSPFLVDADMLDRARKVFISEDGSTKASSDLRRGFDDPRKSGATYAIHSALNMNVAESLLLGCLPVVVEGPSDQHYLTTIKILLIAAKRIAPTREIVFPPSHGAKNAKVVASILSGRDETLPMMLLDGDDVGRKTANDLKNGIYKEAKGRVLSTNSYVDFTDSEIEDLFPIEYLAGIVDRLFRQADVPFADVAKAGGPIVPQIEAWALSQHIELPEGWKVEMARETKKRALTQGHSKFADDVLDRWMSLFEALLAE